MNKKEVLEIRRQFSPERVVISRICGCYVDGEKNKRMELNESFLTLPEEDVFKYCEIFKKSLSGNLGKNLLNMEFPLIQEASGGTQEFLLRLRDSKLRDEELLEEFYDGVIDSYMHDENYLILLIHAVYDIPGKASDNAEMFDASEDVYEFLLGTICPVNLSKPGLSYEAEANRLESRTRDWVVDMPMHGFLFPAFNDRATDIHSMLYYTKKSDVIQEEFIDSMFGCKRILIADEQRGIFNSVVAIVFGDDGKFADLIAIQECLAQLLEENKENPEPVTLDKKGVRNLLIEANVSPELLEGFNCTWDSFADEDAELLVNNICCGKVLNVELAGAKVKAELCNIGRLEHKIIDGQYCLVIPTDRSVAIDGVVVRN